MGDIRVCPSALAVWLFLYSGQMGSKPLRWAAGGCKDAAQPSTFTAPMHWVGLKDTRYFSSLVDVAIDLDMQLDIY